MCDILILKKIIIIIKITVIVLVFDVSSDSDDEENVIVRPQANQFQNEDLNSNYL